MVKSQMLGALENAKSVHLTQMKKVEDELAGKRVQNPTALSKLECECGIWFYENEKLMIDVLGENLYGRLDKNHDEWHRDYTNLYNVFFKDERKKGMFSKIISLSQFDKIKMKKANYYFSALQRDTDELLNATNTAMKKVEKMDPDTFANL